MKSIPGSTASFEAQPLGEEKGAEAVPPRGNDVIVFYC